MFRKITKMPCYVLIYKEIDIIKASLDFFTDLSEYLDIVIIENPSESSSDIKPYIGSLGRSGKIGKHYLFEKNITNNAFDVVVQNELGRISKSKYVVVSDGDLSVKDGVAWLNETKKILKHRGVFCCGVGMLTDNLPLETFPDAKNWIPEPTNEGLFNEGRTGCHLLTMSGKNLAKFMKWKSHSNRYFTDKELAKFCYEHEHKKWGQTRINKAYHHTWDLYGDPNHNYTKLKVNKSFQDTWYHKDTSAYKLTEY